MATTRRIALAIALVVTVAAGAGLAAADQPQPPAAYYGSVTVGGEQAPAGVTIQALVDGEVVGDLTVSEEGSYGGPDPFDDRLVVDCDCSGDTVEFRLEETGEVAGTTVVWESGTVRQVDLSFPESDVGDGSDQGDGSDETDGDQGDGSDATDGDDGHVSTDVGDGTERDATEGAAGGDQTHAGTSGGGGGGGGGGGAGGAGGAGAATSDEVSVSVTDLDRGATAAIENPPTDEEAEVDLGDAVASEGLSIRGLLLDHRITPEEYRVEIDTPQTEAPDETDELDGADAMGYFRAEAIGTEEVDEVTFTFTVNESELPDGTEPEAVTMFRHVDGEWQALETEHVASDGGVSTYEALSPGFSYFAVGAERADLSVADASLADAEVATGDTVTVEVTVENDGAAEGTRTVELRFDGETVTTSDVTVAPGDSETVELAVPAEEAGEYALTVDGVDAGTLHVEDGSADGATETADGDENGDGTATEAGAPVQEELGVSVPGFTPVSALIALVIAGLLALRRPS